MFRTQSVLQYVSWVIITSYLLLRGLYVLVLVPLAGGLANPVARDLRWLYLLEIAASACLFWRTRIAAILATGYFVLMSFVWIRFNSTGVGWFFYDRSLDFGFISAIYVIAWVRHGSKSLSSPSLASQSQSPPAS